MQNTSWIYMNYVDRRGGQEKEVSPHPQTFTQTYLAAASSFAVSHSSFSEVFGLLYRDFPTGINPQG